MKFFFTTLLLALLAVLALASSAQKPIVVSYPAGTPDSVIQAAIEAIETAGGVITHEYKLIKGFAARVSKDAINALEAVGGNAVIEDDKEMSINGL